MFPAQIKRITTEGMMYRAIIAAALSALWLIAFGSNALILSGTAQAGNTVKSSKSNTSDRATNLNSSRSNIYRSTTVKSSKSNTSDRKGTNNRPGGLSPGFPGGGRGY
jgi:hypothetical protein